MAFDKIENSEMTGKLIAELADVPELTADELKKRFDELPKEVIVPKFNKLIDDLKAVSAASNIGMEAPEGITADQNIAAVIVALASIVKDNTDDRHTHTNKTTLDAISESVKESYDKLVTLLAGINQISDIISDRSDALATCKAVVDYVVELGGGDMLKAIYDENDDGIVDNASKLGGNDPAYYQPVTDNSLETDDKTVPGAINEVRVMAQNGGKPMIGDEFSSEKDYAIGDYAIYDNVLYKFIEVHSAGAWDESHVEATTVAGEIGELSEKLQDTLRWKRLAEVVGKTEITLPKSFSELLIVAHNATKSYVYTINVPHDCLTEETNVYFRNGIGNQGGRDYVSYNINLSRILLASMFAANSDSTTSATTIVYYR